jgi:hypothetical protein
MDTAQTTPIEPGNRIRLPDGWAEALGLRDEVLLVKRDDGILVCPLPRATSDEIFADKLSVKPEDAASAPDVTAVTGDDLLS